MHILATMTRLVSIAAVRAHPARVCVRASASVPGPRIVVCSNRARQSFGDVALPAATRRAGVATLGCSPVFFEQWTRFALEEGDDGFALDDRTGVWNFDHVVPQHAAKNGHEQWALVHHWSNVRPMNARLNSRKGHRRDPLDEAEHLKLVQKFLVEHSYGDVA